MKNSSDPGISDCDAIRQKLGHDIRVMLTYVLEEGLELTPAMIEKASGLCAPEARPANDQQLDAEVMAELSAAIFGETSSDTSDSSKSPEPPPPGGTPAGKNSATSPAAEPRKNSLQALMEMHALLTKAVTPATPNSIEATARGTRFWEFLNRPPLVGGMIVVALLSLVGFILTLPPDASAPSANTLSILNEFHWTLAAALGAGFYTLFSVYDYVRDRTYDPSYNGVYIVRFILGVIAGLVLANIFPFRSISPDDPNLSRAVVALLGGFSTEAVNQILQRLVDVMIAAVRGSGADAAKARLDELKAKSAAQLADTRHAMKKDLSEVLANPAIDPALRAQIQGINDKI